MANTSPATIRTRTTRKLASAFARVARDNGRSVAEELRRIVQEHVAEHDANRKG